MEHDRNTWPELERLAREVPEAGVHFQGEQRSRSTISSQHPTDEKRGIDLER